MKNLRITESCLVLGQHVEVGTILRDVDNPLAAYLVANNRAVVITEAVVDPDPAPEHRDPPTTTKAGKGRSK